MTENGDLLLTQHETQSSPPKPVWWANSGDYNRTAEVAWERYATLTPAGILRVERLGKSEDVQYSRQWSSEDIRLCKESKTPKFSSKPPTSQALALENNGRLSIFNAHGKISCVLYPGRDFQSIPELHKGTDFSVDENPAIPIHIEGMRNTLWPKYRDSDYISLLQLRAMLERDLADRNITLDLNSTQLETIYNTAIVIPTWHGHLELVEKFLR